MTMEYSTIFEVEGTGDFPIDMLRRAKCFPCMLHDSVKIMEGQGRRHIFLKKFHTTRDPHLLEANWLSLAWKVNTTNTGKLM